MLTLVFPTISLATKKLSINDRLLGEAINKVFDAKWQENIDKYRDEFDIKMIIEELFIANCEKIYLFGEVRVSGYVLHDRVVVNECDATDIRVLDDSGQFVQGYDIKNVAELVMNNAKSVVK